MDIINISESKRSYPEFDSLIIVTAAIAISLEYRMKGSALYRPGEYLTIEGLSSGKMIRLPLHGPIEAVIANRKPDEIQITILEYNALSKGSKPEISALQDTLNYVFSPYFITFYERNYEDAESKFGKEYATWPSSWRAAWVVRNALSHNGRVYYKDATTPGVTWRGLKISPADQDTKLLGEKLNICDLLILLLDMEHDLEL